MPGERAMAAWPLHDTLVAFTKLETMPNAIRESALPDGAAISVRDAELCLREYLRTSRFMKGLCMAVSEARDRFHGERIHILDAGFGPFDLLGLSLTVWYSSDEIGFTLLEYQPSTLDLARRVVSATASEDYLIRAVCGDATRYQCPPEHIPHVVLTETVASALRREPQVAIAANLAPQLAPGGFLVPEGVEVGLALLRPMSIEGQAAPLWKAPILRLDAASALTELKCHSVRIPEARPGECFHLLTQIQVFDSIKLALNECSLTLPVPLKDGEALHEGDALHFSYRGGEYPGLYRESAGVASRRPTL